MIPKKIILLIFILISLNSFYQPIQIKDLRYKHTIVRQINLNEDSVTKEISEKNKKILLRELISLKLQVMLINKEIGTDNTS
jgi:hypothetical protein